MEQPLKFTVTANKVGNSLKITLPKEVANFLEIKPGDNVELWQENKHISLTKKK